MAFSSKTLPSTRKINFFENSLFSNFCSLSIIVLTELKEYQRVQDSDQLSGFQTLHAISVIHSMINLSPITQPAQQVALLEQRN